VARARRSRSAELRALAAAIAAAAVLAGCAGEPPAASRGADAGRRPSILLVTLDTTRADAIGPDAAAVETPAFNRLAARGLRFRQAYATVPETLPSHTSIMTGLYPAGHGVHENARTVPATQPLLAERLRQAGYHTAAVVSAFTLARQFGLGRGFDDYDDSFAGGASERTASATTDVALRGLRESSPKPRFLWVHYYDPHAPYAPPEPFRSRYAARPYLGEVAAMDRELGRLVQAFDDRVRQDGGTTAMVVVADHGEGLGDHGEPQHGVLVYQSTMHVPLVLAGPGVAAGAIDAPVSTRRVFHTILEWAGIDRALSLLAPAGSAPVAEVVLGEGMKPFLEFGWQPQVMAVAGVQKAILAGKLETYDLAADPGEARNLGSGTSLPAPMRKGLEDYPAPSPDAARAPEQLDDEARRRLASLGYVGAGSAPLVRRDAPRPADMVRLFDVIEKASGLFASGSYAAAIPLLDRILAEDPFNLDAALRLGTAHSALGHRDQAVEMFRRAGTIAPKSPDVRLYLALHYARGPEWAQAIPLLEQIVRDSPDRLPALEALALVRERQGRLADAIALAQQVYRLRTPTAAELSHLGMLAMEAGQTPVAIEALERGQRLDPATFPHDLDLGVLYLDARRLPEARDALDRVKVSDPGYPMALFKRAQVSVLLNEPDRAARIALARQHADATTRPLIARERLFR
jgi:choline-sulfatase